VTGEVLAAAIRVLRLPPRDRRRALEAAAQLTRASVELRLIPRRRVIRLLGALRPDDPPELTGDRELHEAEQVGHDVSRAASRLPWHPTCLRQALAVQRMLRSRGIASRLHLGVTGVSEGAAHAWVTVAGHPVVGLPGRERFVPLAEFK
jgi:transglutaminase superfamily protein